MRSLQLKFSKKFFMKFANWLLNLIRIRARIISVYPGCMVKILTKIKKFKKRKPEREK